MEQRSFCAFISYRHQSPDMEIAKRLHTLIENYTVPAGIRREKTARHPGKVFRDQDELPLSPDLGKDIETALDNSQWLIAICSPRYLQSKWCMREIEYFIEKHGRERVLTVLAEGEPENSFPKALMYRVNAAGEKTDAEPLAADVRAPSLRGSLKKLKKEKLRILAPMLNTSYDGLYQRQRRRAVTRALVFSGAAVLALGGFLTYALAQNARIDAQRVTAAQNECDLLVEKSIYYTAQNRKADALEMALSAHEVSQSIDGYNEKQIQEALAVSCFEGDFDIEAQIALPGSGDRVADKAGFSPDGRWISAVVSFTQVACCDARTGEQRWVSIPLGNHVTSLAWSGDSSMLAAASQWGHTICVMDAESGERRYEMVGVPDIATGNRPPDAKEIFLPVSVRFSPDGDALFVINDEGLWRWDFRQGTDPRRLVDFQAGQNPVIRYSNDGRKALVQNTLPNAITIVTLPQSSEEQPALETFCPSDLRVINGFALSPDGTLLYVHQFASVYVCDPRTGEIRWLEEVEGNISPGGSPRWLGDIILDGSTVRSAADGTVLYEVKDSIVGVTPDGKYLMGEKRFYHVADGSLYAEIPGTLLAADASGRHLLVRTKSDYRDREDGTAVPYQTNYYQETAPGCGSQYTVAQYDGVLTAIPDWSVPDARADAGLLDRYGKSTMGFYASRMYVSPSGRFIIQANVGDYVPIYDLEKGNEPVYRLFEFNASEPVTASTLNALPGAQVITVPEVAAVAFQAEGSLAVFAGVSGYITVYDLENGRLVQSYTDMLYRRALSGAKFNRAGTMFMTADFDWTHFYVYSVTNGLRLYALHAVSDVADWGFDDETGDAVILYKDGGALIARAFSDEKELYAYAEQRRQAVKEEEAQP